MGVERLATDISAQFSLVLYFIVFLESFTRTSYLLIVDLWIRSPGVNIPTQVERGRSKTGIKSSICLCY